MIIDYRNPGLDSGFKRRRFISDVIGGGACGTSGCCVCHCAGAVSQPEETGQTHREVEKGELVIFHILRFLHFHTSSI